MESTSDEGEMDVKAEAITNQRKVKPGCWTATHTITLMGFLIFLSEYAMRVNMSVTILPMSEEFEWDEPTQGLVLGAFYYGYAWTNFFGGRASELFGGKIVLTASLIITGLLTLLTVVVARWSVPMLVALRIAEGLAEGVCFPAMTYFMSKWVPIEEKARTSSRIWTGNLFGTFVTLPIGGWLSSSSWGWPSVFYITGAFGIVLGILWMLVVTDDPRNMKSISQEELKHIVEECQLREHEGSEPIPWLAIAKSPSVWFISLVHFGDGVAFYAILIELPTYLVKIYKFSLSYAGTISGAAYFVSWIFAIAYSTFVTFLLNKGYINVPYMRRISQGLSCYGTSIGFVCLMLINNSTIVVVILLISGMLSAAQYSGYMASHADVSPRFSGTVMGIANTIGTTTGFIIPAIVGKITHNNQTPAAWHYVFLIVLLINVILSTPYIIFYKAEIEPWNSRRSSSPTENTSIVERENSAGSPVSAVAPEC